MYMSDGKVLERNYYQSSESIILQFQWVGHLVRMEDSKTSKQFQSCELRNGKRPIHKTKLRFKDCIETCQKLEFQNSWKNLQKVKEGL